MNDPLCYLLMVGAPGRDVTGYALPLLLFRPPPQESASRKRHSIELRGAANLEASARRGAAAAYALLWNERIVQRSIELGMEVALPALAGGRVPLADGDSATLAFALGFMVATEGQRNYPKFAATGFVHDDGRVSTFVDHDSNDRGDLGPSRPAPRQRIQGIPLKLEAAVSALGRGSWVFYPQDAEEEVGHGLKVRARQAGVVLCPIEHLIDAAEAFGIEVSQIHLESPFRGLEAFEYEHRSIYFGRQGDIKEFCDLLDTRERFDMPSLVVLGASGRGKSSFVQAGVVPELKRRHRSRNQSELDFVVWRPGEVGSGGGSVGQFVLQACRRQLPLPEEDPGDFGPESLADYLVQHLKGSGWRLLLLVDQTEELFTQYVAPEALTQLGELFCALQARGVSVVCTLRDDFYTQFATHPSLGRAFARTAHAPNGVFHLGPLLPADLQQVIEAPVEALGYTFEAHPQRGTLLSSQILAECLENSGTDTLPLVQFSLEQLFRKALSRGDRTIRWIDYEGGLSRAVARHAAAAVDGLPPHVREALPWLARHLTVIDGRGNVNARPFRLKTDTPSQAGRSSLVECLASPASRLLVVADLGGGELQVRLAHEALLQHWGALKQEVETCRSDIELASALERDARAWAVGARDILWRGKRLREATDFERRRADKLDDPVWAFIRASLAHSARTGWLRVAGAALVMGMAALAILWTSSERRREAEDAAFTEIELKLRAMLATKGAWDDRQAVHMALAAHLLAGDRNRPASFLLLGEVNERLSNLVLTMNVRGLQQWTFSPFDAEVMYIVADECVYQWNFLRRSKEFTLPIIKSKKSRPHRFEVVSEADAARFQRHCNHFDASESRQQNFRGRLYPHEGAAWILSEQLRQRSKESRRVDEQVFGYKVKVDYSVKYPSRSLINLRIQKVESDRDFLLQDIGSYAIGKRGGIAIVDRYGELSVRAPSGLNELFSTATVIGAGFGAPWLQFSDDEHFLGSQSGNEIRVYRTDLRVDAGSSGPSQYEECQELNLRGCNRIGNKYLNSDWAVSINRCKFFFLNPNTSSRPRDLLCRSNNALHRIVLAPKKDHSGGFDWHWIDGSSSGAGRWEKMPLWAYPDVLLYAVSERGNLGAAVLRDQTIHLFDVVTEWHTSEHHGRQLSVEIPPGFSYTVTDLSLSADKVFLAAIVEFSSDTTDERKWQVLRWNLLSGSDPHVLWESLGNNYQWGPQRVSFSDDNSILIAGATEFRLISSRGQVSQPSNARGAILDAIWIDSRTLLSRVHSRNYGCWTSIRKVRAGSIGEERVIHSSEGWCDNDRLVISADKAYVLVPEYGGVTRLFHIESGVLMQSIARQDGPVSLGKENLFSLQSMAARGLSDKDGSLYSGSQIAPEFFMQSDTDWRIRAQPILDGLAKRLCSILSGPVDTTILAEIPNGVGEGTYLCQSDRRP